MKILAVGAHPDDVELGCGATLALFKKMRHQVFVLILTRGEASGDPEIREIECRKSAEILCADGVYFGNMQDTKITEGVDTIMKIENVLKKVKADFVFAHSSKDVHQDHRNAGLATLSAARDTGRVLLYESPAALRDFCPQVFVDVTSTFEVKLNALKTYGSQASKVYFKGEQATQRNTRTKASARSRYLRFPHVSNAVEGLARFRGFQAGVKLAEAFEVGKFMLDIKTDQNSSTRGYRSIG